MINSPLFIVYLLSSFLVIRIVVTLVTVIAENTNREFAGIIVSIPSTIFISFLAPTLLNEQALDRTSLECKQDSLFATEIIQNFERLWMEMCNKVDVK